MIRNDKNNTNDKKPLKQRSPNCICEDMVLGQN